MSSERHRQLFPHPETRYFVDAAFDEQDTYTHEELVEKALQDGYVEDDRTSLVEFGGSLIPVLGDYVKMGHLEFEARYEGKTYTATPKYRETQ